MEHVERRGTWNATTAPVFRAVPLVREEAPRLTTCKGVYAVASYRQSDGIGCIPALLLVLLLIFVPLLGHIILTVMILTDDLSGGEKLLWLVVIWLIPFLGPFLYLLLGQRRNRLMSQIG